MVGPGVAKTFFFAKNAAMYIHLALHLSFLIHRQICAHTHTHISISLTLQRFSSFDMYLDKAVFIVLRRGTLCFHSLHTLDTAHYLSLNHGVLSNGH